MKLHRLSFISGSVLCLFAVAIGAFGAHALSDLLIENQRMATFDTASKYHFYHALALLIISVLSPPSQQVKTLNLASLSMLLGVLFFSGSLYLLALTNATFLGMIAPIGGFFFLIAWGLLIKLGLQWLND